PRLAAVRCLNDRCACPDDPTAIVVDEDPAEQQPARWRLQLHPRLAGIACGPDRTGFAKRPATPVAIEHRANENRIDVESFDLEFRPVLAAVRRLHEIAARIFVFELVSVYLDDHPAIAVVDEEEIANGVFTLRATRRPGVATV